MGLVCYEIKVCVSIRPLSVNLYGAAGWLLANGVYVGHLTGGRCQMLWKQMLCGLTTPLTFHPILPLSHKHALSCLLYNIYNVLSCALFHHLALTQTPIQTHNRTLTHMGVALFVILMQQFGAMLGLCQVWTRTEIESVKA